jgi:hypothetical protein
MPVQETHVPTYEVTLLSDQTPGGRELIAGNGFPLFCTITGHGTFNAILRQLPGAGITSDTHIFAAVTEVNSEGFPFQGDATCRVSNVSPFPNQPDSGILVRLTVEWESDLPLRVDFLVINA